MTGIMPTKGLASERVAGMSTLPILSVGIGEAAATKLDGLPHARFRRLVSAASPLAFLDVLSRGYSGAILIGPGDSPAASLTLADEAHQRLVSTPGFVPLALVGFPPEFAARAFDLGALDFVSLPAKPARLKLCLDRLREATAYRRSGAELEAMAHELDRLRYRHAVPLERRLSVSRHGEERVIDLDEVEWIVSHGSGTQIRVEQLDFGSRFRIGEIAKRLDQRKFLLVHVSLLVRRSVIAEVKQCVDGAVKLITRCGTKLPVSRSGLDVLRIEGFAPRAPSKRSGYLQGQAPTAEKIGVARG